MSCEVTRSEFEIKNAHMDVAFNIGRTLIQAKFSKTMWLSYKSIRLRTDIDFITITSPNRPKSQQPITVFGSQKTHLALNKIGTKKGLKTLKNAKKRMKMLKNVLPPFCPPSAF